MEYFKYLLLSLFLLLSPLAFSAPILNVQDAPISHDLSLAQIKKAIINSGLDRGWIMTAVSDGDVRGELNIRSHQAVVSITYTQQTYSINYVDSVNLKAKNGQIHRNYNNWINNLNQDIQRALNREALGIQ